MLHATLKQLSDGLATGKFSSVEVTQYFINRINNLNKSLNSFISLDTEKSLAQARAADALRAAGRAQPLTGVPIAQKDIFLRRGLAHDLRLEDAVELRVALRRPCD